MINRLDALGAIQSLLPLLTRVTMNKIITISTKIAIAPRITYMHLPDFF